MTQTPPDAWRMGGVRAPNSELVFAGQRLAACGGRGSGQADENQDGNGVDSERLAPVSGCHGSPPGTI